MQDVGFPHYSLSPDEYTTLLESNSFEVIEMNISDPNCFEQSVWIARKK